MPKSGLFSDAIAALKQVLDHLTQCINVEHNALYCWLAPGMGGAWLEVDTSRPPPPPGPAFCLPCKARLQIHTMIWELRQYDAKIAAGMLPMPKQASPAFTLRPAPPFNRYRTNATAARQDAIKAFASREDVAINIAIHSMNNLNACSACGDLDGCHVPARLAELWAKDEG